MLIEKSPLVLKNTTVYQFDYSFQLAENASDLNIYELSEKYHIDLDFRHEILEEDELFVSIKLEINNQDKPITPGYIIVIHISGFFSIDSNSKISDNEKKSILSFGSVNVLLGRVREIISSFTAKGPLGSYELPLIDLTPIFQNKAKAQIEEQS